MLRRHQRAENITHTVRDHQFPIQYFSDPWRDSVIYANVAKHDLILLCVAVMHSGEYDVFGVILSVQPHQTS
jgi:hypothetical protein